jgi:fido (protein-threonine AMPylation protein)
MLFGGRLSDYQRNQQASHGQPDEEGGTQVVAMNLDYPPGATQLDPDEAAGLLPAHIANHGQLNEWEMVNILEGEQWAFGRRHADVLESEFVCRLHKRMFGNTWRWNSSARC